MSTITIPKKEYQKLLETKSSYDYLRKFIDEGAFCRPPIKSTREIIKTLKTTRKYSKEFIESLEKGLKRSSYFTPGEFCLYTRRFKNILGREG